MRALLLGFAALVPFCIQTARADPAEDFFRGKQISFYIGYNAGDTFDVYSRLAAAHLTRLIPGHPGIVPKNMPGVASLKAADYLYNQAPRDGTAIGMLGQAVALEQLLDNPAAHYDVRKFNWIGRMSWTDQFGVAWHTSPVHSIDDVLKTELVIAATSAEGITAMMPRLLNNIIGTKFKIVLGYPGITGSLLAMERGEVEGTTATGSDLLNGHAEWLRDKKVSVLVQYTLNRSADFPDSPAISELGRTPEQTQILKLYGGMAEIGRSILAPPDVPADRVAALRAAFDALMKDQAFLDDCARAKMQLQPLAGEPLQKFVAASLDVSPETAKRAGQAREQ